MERVSLPVWLEYSQVRAELAARRPASRQPSHPDSPLLPQSFWGEQPRPSLLQAAVTRLREDCYRLKGSRRQLSQDWPPPTVKTSHRRVASNKSTQVSPRPQPILTDISSILETADFNDASFTHPVDEKQYCFISKWQPKSYLLKAREKGGKLLTCDQPGRLLELGVPLHSDIQVTATGITGGLRLWVGSAKLSSGERLVRVLASAHCVFLSPREVLCSDVLPTALLA